MPRLNVRSLIAFALVASFVALAGPAPAQAATAGSPIGHLDAVEPSPGTLTAAGWALDPDSSGHNAAVAVFADGMLVAYTAAATASRPDVGALYPTSGPNHGFTLTFSLASGAHTVCAVGLNAPGTAGADEVLGCVAVNVGAPFGVADAVDVGSLVTVQGWAIDPDTADPIAVAVFVDGVLAAYTPSADVERPGVGVAYPDYGSAHGFELPFRASVGTHVVCAVGLNAPGTGGTDNVVGCLIATVPALLGNFEQVRIIPGGLRVSGWAADSDSGDVSLRVAVYDNGVLVAYSGAADGTRPDVAAAYPTLGAGHGFDLPFAAGAGQHQICVVAFNVAGTNGSDAGLGCQTFALAPTIGRYESFTRVSSTTVRVNGWAIDTATSGPATYGIFVDGNIVDADVATVSRPDVAAVYPEFGPNHGFSPVVYAPPGSYLCVLIANYNVDPERIVILGCSFV